MRVARKIWDGQQRFTAEMVGRELGEYDCDVPPVAAAVVDPPRPVSQDRLPKLWAKVQALLGEIVQSMADECTSIRGLDLYTRVRVQGGNETMLCRRVGMVVLGPALLGGPHGEPYADEDDNEEDEEDDAESAMMRTV